MLQLPNDPLMPLVHVLEPWVVGRGSDGRQELDDVERIGNVSDPGRNTPFDAAVVVRHHEKRGLLEAEPSGWKRTSASVSEGATAVMLTVSWRAPRGTTNQLRRTSSTPPSGPIVWVTDSYGRGRQETSESPSSSVSSPSSASSPPGWCEDDPDAIRPGARASTPSGDGVPQCEAATAAPSSKPSEITRRRRDMRFSECRVATDAELRSLVRAGNVPTRGFGLAR